MHTQNDAPAPESKEDKIRRGCYLLSLMPKEQQNIMAMSVKLNVSYHTLRNRFLGKTLPAKEAQTQKMLLSPAQERALCEWITYLASTGHPVCKRTLKFYAKELCGTRPSKGWVMLFYKRHPDLRLGKATGLDPRRAQAFNRPVVERHFAQLQELVNRFQIPVENIYNMDEKGVQRGGGKKSSSRKYFVSRKARTNYKHRSPNLELITIIECVCADGSGLKPGFVFAGKEYCPEWFEIDPEITLAMSENGWTDDFIGHEWFEKCFLPQAKARNVSGKPILLVYDGHGSHETTPLIRCARKNGIILLSLPPHTTHMLQPLDVGVFGPFQRAWIQRCDEIVEDLDEEMPKRDFVAEYMAVRTESFKESVVLSAWKKSGNWPINPRVFTDLDYAPSIPFSTTARDFPDSFPVDKIRATFLSAGTTVDEDDMWSDDSDDEMGEPEYFSVPNIVSRTPSFELPIAPSVSLPPMTPAPSTHRLTRSNTHSEDTPPSKRLKTSPYSAEYIRALEEQVQYLTAQCGLAGTQIGKLKRKENAKAAKKNGRAKLNCEARVLTSAEGMRIVEQREREAAEKEAEKQRREDERIEKENQEQALRESLDETTVFRGSIASKTKAGLKDLAHVLGLSLIAGETNKELATRITNFFEANPAKAQEPRFLGLFNRSRAPATAATSPESHLLNVSNQTTNAIAGPSSSPRSMDSPEESFSQHVNYNSTALYHFDPFPTQYSDVYSAYGHPNEQLNGFAIAPQYDDSLFYNQNYYTN